VNTVTKKEIKIRSPENNISIIGVFDGHGGSFISRFVAENFMTVFNNSWIKSYIKGLANDNQLRNKTVQIQNIDFEQ
jgi:serine/threonine protein phosphatase PrpC